MRVEPVEPVTMCGIACLHRVRGSTNDADELAVRAMLDAQAHRGPDGSGLFRSDRALLGHRRLAVIDLSGGQQPIANETGDVHVVCNGEIYNYAQLARELAAQGHRFSSATDTEVLVHGYEQWGIRALLPRLTGMFSFVLWDARQHRLVAARDRMGQKPLYYRLSNDVLTIASELKALLAVPGGSRVVDPDALLLCMQLLYVPEGHCILRGIQKLPPASFMTVEGERTRVEPYWTPYGAGGQPPASPEDARERVRGIFDAAVAMQLRSDVPVGVFLSGGVDSSLVALSAARQHTERLRTLTVRFPGLVDESPFARQIAERCGGEHVDLDVTPHRLDDVMRAVVRQFDEPLADSSTIPSYCISQAARPVVKVVLTGDGGDELFSGYGWYQDHLRAGRQAGGRATGSVLGMVGQVLRRSGAAVAAARRFAPWAAASVRDAIRIGQGRGRSTIARHRSLVAGQLDHGFLSADLRAALTGASDAFFVREDIGDDPLETVRAFDVDEYLPGDILRKADGASMAHGLEVRSPFMDHHLAELALSLPVSWNVTEAGGKRMLKDLLAAEMGQAFVTRPKQGFGLPVAAWLRSAELHELVETTLSRPERGSGLWAPQRVRDTVSGFYRGRDDLAFPVWTLLTLELWARDYLVAV